MLPKFVKALECLPPHFCQLCDSIRVLLVECVTPLLIVLFLPAFVALPTKQGCMLQNTFERYDFLLLDALIADSRA